MTMFKTTGNAYEVTTPCRKCGKDVVISVIELSRLHHPPLCEDCLVKTPVPIDPYAETQHE